MVNHFLIESVACTPAAGWEKGQVERQVQTLRKRFFYRCSPLIHWPLPECIKTRQKHLISQPKGDKAMVKLLSLIADFGEGIGITATEIALEQGISTVEVVVNIILRLTEPAIPELESQL